MPHDEGLAETVRADLDHLPDLREIRMFGGLCFPTAGHMVCGLTGDGGLYRVGKDGQEAALALPDVTPAIMGGRRMGSYVRAGPEAMADDDTRASLTGMALRLVAALPPK